MVKEADATEFWALTPETVEGEIVQFPTQTEAQPDRGIKTLNGRFKSTPSHHFHKHLRRFPKKPKTQWLSFNLDWQSIPFGYARNYDQAQLHKSLPPFAPVPLVASPARIITLLGRGVLTIFLRKHALILHVRIWCFLQSSGVRLPRNAIPQHEALTVIRQFALLKRNIMNICRILAMTGVMFLVAPWAGRGADLASDARAKSLGYAGTVVETMNAASYTYVQVDTGKEKIWAATPQFPVKVGDKVSFADGIAMGKYESKTLKRTFDMIYFVGGIKVAGQPASPAGENPHVGLKGDPHAGVTGMSKPASAPVAVADFSAIKKPAGGLTVSELFAQKSTLANKQITVRGKVVKYNRQILGKNWLHLQDGTGGKGANDLTITTADTTQVGDTVLVNGTLVLNKDFGAGYKYDLLLEDARITVEPTAKP